MNKKNDILVFVLGFGLAMIFIASGFILNKVQDDINSLKRSGVNLNNALYDLRMADSQNHQQLANEMRKEIIRLEERISNMKISLPYGVSSYNNPEIIIFVNWEFESRLNKFSNYEDAIKYLNVIERLYGN